MSEVEELKTEIRQAADPVMAKNQAWYFKTGAGEYGEGDIFLGLTVPSLRKIAAKYTNLSLSDIKKLLQQKEHEFRLAALFVLVSKSKNADVKFQDELAKFYLDNTVSINNWDLVDCSAYQIIGPYSERNTDILTELAKSNNIWEKRIAMIATAYYIKQKDSAVPFGIAKILLHDPHDLIQKAVGWMLRETGRACGEPVLEEFLRSNNYKTIPRTTLRYAIERFDSVKRQSYLRGQA